MTLNQTTRERNKLRELKRKYKELEDIHKRTSMLLTKYIEHGRGFCPKDCKECKKWFDGIIEWTKNIKDKKTRETLLKTWNNLWANNDTNWDVIFYTISDYKNE